MGSHEVRNRITGGINKENQYTMVRIKKYKNRIEEFLSGENGQRFFNFAYSIGAAIVIWGALFKILHLPGGNLLLAIGMGTEVLMFILTAFDRPPRHYHWEEVFPELEGGEPRQVPVQPNGVTVVGSPVLSPDVSMGKQELGMSDGTVVNHAIPSIGTSTEPYAEEMENLVKELARLRETTSALNTLYEMQIKSVSTSLGRLESSSQDVAMMKDMIEKSARQSERYCEETEKMAQNMAMLNSIYSGMISAMNGNKQ